MSDVTDRARFLIKFAAFLDAKRLGHVDLHAVYVVANPMGSRNALANTKNKDYRLRITQ